MLVGKIHLMALALNSLVPSGSPASRVPAVMAELSWKSASSYDAAGVASGVWR